MNRIANQISARSDRRRSGRPLTDQRMSALSRPTDSANQIALAASGSSLANGAMANAKAGRYLY